MLDSQISEQLAERHRIYSSHAAKAKQPPGAAHPVFPPISTSPQPAGEGEATGVHPAVAMLNHIQKLRNTLKERDVAVHDLRQENSTLRQIDRRHQKDIKELQGQYDDAPRVIQGLREENSALKQKLKEYYVHLTADQRQIRAINKNNLSLKEQNRNLHVLVEEEELGDRKLLEEKVVKLEASLEQEIKNSKNELMAKNFNSENKHLRGKVQSVEQEGVVYKERAIKLAAAVKEKDKEVASLSIYRYNAIHRKGGDGNCKVCAKREKDEEEKRRRDAISAKLPLFEAPFVEVVDAKSIKIDLIVPLIMRSADTPQATSSIKNVNKKTLTNAQSSSILRLKTMETKASRRESRSADTLPVDAPVESTAPDFSHVVIKCSSDPTFTDPALVQESRVESVHFTVSNIQSTIPDGSKDEEVSLSTLDTVTHHYSMFHELNPGVYYHIKIYALNGDIEGPVTEHSVLCDLVPLAPVLPPEPKQEQNDRSIRLRMNKVAQSENQESRATKYLIYHSLTEDMSEKYLVGEVALPEADSDSSSTEHIEFVYKSPDMVAVDHYFCYSCANRCGEGPMSGVSTGFRIGRPSKPLVARTGEKGTSLHVLSSLEPNGSSEPLNWAVYVFQVLETGETDVPIIYDIAVPGHGLDEVNNETQDEESEPVEKLLKAEETKTVERKASFFSRQPGENGLPDLLVTPYYLSHTISSLTPGRYHVQVLSTNAMGKSPSSSVSDDIDLELLIPIPTSLPSFTIISTSSVTFSFTDIFESGTPPRSASPNSVKTKPKKTPLPRVAGVPVKQRRIYSSLEPDMNNPVLETPTPLDFSQPSLTLSKLSPAQQYYFAMSYVGPKGDEGRKSRAIFVPLAAAIMLPETPPRFASTSSLMEIVQSRRTSNSSLRGSLGSMSSLSKRERWGNMHNGRPANHDSMTPPLPVGGSTTNIIHVTAPDDEDKKKSSDNVARKGSIYRSKSNNAVTVRKVGRALKATKLVSSKK